MHPVQESTASLYLLIKKSLQQSSTFLHQRKDSYLENVQAENYLGRTKNNVIISDIFFVSVVTQSFTSIMGGELDLNPCMHKESGLNPCILPNELQHA